MIIRNFKYFIAAVIAVVCISFLLNCAKDGGTPSSPVSINSITLTSLDTAGIWANGQDTTIIGAQVFMSDGSPAPQGTIINFYTTMGIILSSSDSLDQEGNASTYLVSAAAIGIA